MNESQVDFLEVVAPVWADMLASTSGHATPPFRTLPGCPSVSRASSPRPVECARNLAERIAVTMFQVDADTMEQGAVDDALGENTNIIAGGVKSMVPDATDLSLPAVLGGRVRSPGGVALVSQSFVTREQTFTITLVGRKAERHRRIWPAKSTHK